MSRLIRRTVTITITESWTIVWATQDETAYQTTTVLHAQRKEQKRYVNMNKIIFITGAPGAGKTTIGRRVAERFPKSIHIKVDDLWGSVVSGVIIPGDWTDEATKQFGLARTTAIYMAKLYAANGFVVIIDDVCVPEFFAEQWAELFQRERVDKVLLLPTPAALTERMRKRNGPFEEFFIERAIPWLYSYLEPMDKTGWVVIDSSELTIEQTVDAVLQRIGE